jgi:hypothetical protein
MTIKLSISDILFYIGAIFCIGGYFSGEYLSAIFNGILAILNYMIGWYYNRAYQQ